MSADATAAAETCCGMAAAPCWCAVVPGVTGCAVCTRSGTGAEAGCAGTGYALAAWGGFLLGPGVGGADGDVGFV